MLQVEVLLKTESDVWYFGPFENWEAAEQCVLTLAARTDVIQAFVVEYPLNRRQQPEPDDVQRVWGQQSNSSDPEGCN